MTMSRPDRARILNDHPWHLSRIFGRVRRLEKSYDLLSQELERAVYYLDQHDFDDITGKAALGTTPRFGRNVK